MMRPAKTLNITSMWKTTLEKHFFQRTNNTCSAMRNPEPENKEHNATSNLNYPLMRTMRWLLTRIATSSEFGEH